jgi:hypothetical protein
VQQDSVILLEQAVGVSQMTAAAMLIELGGRFKPGRTLGQLQQLQQLGTDNPLPIVEVRHKLHVQLITAWPCHMCASVKPSTASSWANAAFEQ